MTNVLHGVVEDLVTSGAVNKEHHATVVQKIEDVLEGMVPINEEQTQVFIDGIGAAEVVIPRIRFNRLDYVAQKIHEAFLPWNARNLWSNQWENLSPAARGVRREMARAAMQAMSQQAIEIIDLVRNQEGEIQSVEVLDTRTGTQVHLNVARSTCEADITPVCMGEYI
jgi:BMFP domain-containing protein YqiC